MFFYRLRKVIFIQLLLAAYGPHDKQWWQSELFTAILLIGPCTQIYRIGGVIVNVLPSSSDYKIGICNFSAQQVAL